MCIVCVLTKCIIGDFPGGPVGKTSPSNAGGPGSIPGWGTRSHTHAATKSSYAASKKSRAATKTWRRQNK